LQNDLVEANNQIKYLTSELKMARGKIQVINKDNTDLNVQVSILKDKLKCKRQLQRGRRGSVIEKSKSKLNLKTLRKNDNITIDTDQEHFVNSFDNRISKRSQSIVHHGSTSAFDSSSIKEEQIQDQPLTFDLLLQENQNLKNKLIEKEKELKLMGHRVRDFIIQRTSKSPKYKVSALMKQAENTYNSK